MSIISTNGLEPRAVIERKDGKLYRLVGYWNDPVLILDPIEMDDDGSMTREYICVSSEFARDLSVLRPQMMEGEK